jgi:phosphoribosyl 1,2-cyclic phosphodiesterase
LRGDLRWSPRRRFYGLCFANGTSKLFHINAGTFIKFWGVRGSIATPGQTTVRYGGNTSCIEVRCGGGIIILDAGTGLRALGQSLLKEFKKKPLNLTLLLTHTHWDHIQGLPFFGPIYNPRCRLRILGCEGARKGLVDALTGQMESTYFPVPFDTLPSNIEIEELKDFNFSIGTVLVRAQRANHPGVCVGYRLLSPEGIVTFFPDTEPRRDSDDSEMLKFVRDSDVLILDSQYDRAEYKKHIGWGHGCVDDSIDLALKANVKKLVLFHHDPDHDDARMDELVKYARNIVKKSKSRLQIEAAREGTEIQLVKK